MLTACVYWRNAGMTTKAAENLKIVATTIIPIRMMNPSSTTQYPSSQRSTGSEQDFQECHGLSHASIVVKVFVFVKNIEKQAFDDMRQFLRLSFFELETCRALWRFYGYVRKKN
jgi:hypothetical protein